MSRRAVLKEQRREAVREQILDATRRVVLERGVSGLTLSAVAKELELTKAALYYYFASKEDLVFELVYQAHADHAEAVGAAVAATSTGAGAVEALIRATSAYFSDHMGALRLAFMAPQVGPHLRMKPEALERVRPFNELLFGAVAERIRLDQEAGRIPAAVDGRRLAFVAHTSVLGMMMMEGLVELADDPLIHSHGAMVDELVASFTCRLAQGRPPEAS